MSDKLQQLFDKRKSILKEISDKSADFSGTTILNLQNEVNNLKNLQQTYLNQYKQTQASILEASTMDDVQKIQNELTYLCIKLTELEKSIDNDNQTISSKEQELKNKTPQEEQAEITALVNELNQVENDIKDEMKNQNIINFGEYTIVWINQPYGLFILLCKPCMIRDIMKGLFSVLQDKVSDDEFNNILTDVSDPEKPGLASLISCFIDLLIKSVGNFGIYFFAIKQTVDLLAGLDIGTIMSVSIQMLNDVLSDINLLLSDAPKFMLKNLLGPLFDINIPIPSFNFDLSSIAPFLPFNLPMPKIDPYNLFGKLTPFNKDAANSCLPIPTNWKELFFDQAKQAEKDQQDKVNQKHQDDINNLANQIQEKKDILSGKNITNLENLINIFQNQLNILVRQLNLEKRNFNENKDELSDQGIKDAYIRMNDLCAEIANLENQINLNQLTLAQKKKEFENLDVDKTNKEIDSLNEQKSSLENNPPENVKSLAKRAMIINIENDYGLNDIQDRLNNIRTEGVDVFSDELLRALQGIGYNLKDENYLTKIQKLKVYGFDMKNIAQISSLALIGFTLNDDNFQNKLDNLQKCKIKLNNPEVLGYLGELGFNFNSNSNYLKSLDTINDLYTNGLPIYDINYLKSLFLLGYNFNLKDGLDKLLYLRKYADITQPQSLNNLLKRNVNLNNPNYKYILEEYKQIGLNFNDNSFFDNEKWILDNVKVSDIDIIFSIMEKYRTNLGTGYANGQFGYNYEIAFFKNEWINFFPTVSKVIPFNVDDPKGYLKWTAIPTYAYPVTEQIANYGTIYNTTSFMNKTIPLGKILYKNDGYIYYPEKPVIPLPNSQLPANYNSNIRDAWLNWAADQYPNDAKLQEKEVKEKCKGDNEQNAIDADKKKINRGYEKPDSNYYKGPYFTLPPATPVEPGIPSDYRWAHLNVLSLLTMNDFINQWSSKLSITLDISTPINNIFYVNYIDKNSKYETQLQALKSFVENHGWVINGNPISQTTTTEDLNKIASLFGLKVTTNVNNKDNDKVIDVQEKNSLGNIDKLGLNIRDINYINEITDLRDKIHYTVLTSYYANAQKTKINDLINVSLLSKFGLNFSQNQRNGSTPYSNMNYMDILTQLSSWYLDLTKTTNEGDITALLNIGFHFNQENISDKIYSLNQIHFSFHISMLANKLNALSAMGFNFNKSQSSKMLQMLANRGLYLDNKTTTQTPTGGVQVDQFETQISQINNFGISFNDSQWENKLNKFSVFNINFSNKNWRDQMDNLNLLGINFKDPDWEKKLDDLVRLKKLGLDPTNITLKKKLAILDNMGVNFNKPEDEYSQKVEALILLGAVNITEDNANEKRHFEENQRKQLEDIDNQILNLNNELTGNDLSIMKEQLQMLKYQRRLYLVNYEPPKVYPEVVSQGLNVTVLPLNPEPPYDMTVALYDSGIDVVEITQSVDELGYIYCAVDDDVKPGILGWDIICVID